ncbi:TetR/AcrR family transcriptional regulator [Glycomyces sp. MUSA5-2]|uniref:TetR/AcrR family transcriptional regulator n=1 Tax=Glycomyces sp. MUSA5-2 TaxID=2053002 RepID=UPI00300AB5FB
MTDETEPRRAPAGAALLRSDVTEAIGAAVLDELEASGYARMSMEAVARRAGVGKAALYRRWPSKQSMVEQIVADFAWDAVPVPDTGTLRGDVGQFVADAVELRRDLRAVRIIADLSAEAARNPELAASFLDSVRGPRRRAGTAMLARAVARGELPGSLDAALALDCLVALAYARPYSETEEDAVNARLIDAVMAALGACAA